MGQHGTRLRYDAVCEEWQRKPSKNHFKASILKLGFNTEIIYTIHFEPQPHFHRGPSATILPNRVGWSVFFFFKNSTICSGVIPVNSLLILSLIERKSARTDGSFFISLVFIF